MEEHDLELNLGMLCRCCDRSHRFAEVEGFTARQRQIIEDLCNLCVESFQMTCAER